MRRELVKGDCAARVVPFRSCCASRKAVDAVGIPGSSSILLLLILLYTVFALIQGLFAEISFNRILGAAIFFVLAADFVTKLTSKRVVAACSMGILFVLNVGLFTSDRAGEVEFFIYWTTTLLFLCYVATPGNIERLTKASLHHRFPMQLVVIGSSFLLFVLLMTRSGYVLSWGGGSYFSGFCNTNHTMASVCCILLALSYLLQRNGQLRWWLVLASMSIASYALFETGARTFLIPCVVIWLLYIRDTVSRKWLRFLIYGLLFLAVLYVFSVSGMAEKFNYVSSSPHAGSILSSFTSGRDAYWRTDLGAWVETGPIGLLFGDSASFVYDLNEATFGMNIWAHNDFVMLLCSVGVVGFIIYITALILFFKGFAARVTRYELILLVICVLFPAIVNGFYSYQHLVYAVTVLVCAVAGIGKVKDGESH